MAAPFAAKRAAAAEAEAAAGMEAAAKREAAAESALQLDADAAAVVGPARTRSRRSRRPS